jgi:hypothetical protein
MDAQPSLGDHGLSAAKGQGIRARIRAAALDLLGQHPEGLRYSDLHRRIHAVNPSFKPSTINTSIWNLDAVLPQQVYKPSKGLYRLTEFRRDEPSSTTPQEQVPIQPRTKEEVYYRLFCDWLINEVEEVTHAIPLGGNRFRDKWGTPDAIGKLESRRSDLIKAPTQIHAAEIKVEPSQIVEAYGQCCAYQLFSHKVWLVDSLCEISGIGLVVFDASNPAMPNFELVLRPRANQPDLFYTNRNLALIEKELFD